MQEAPCNARTVRRPVRQNSTSNWSGAPHTGTDRRGSCSCSGKEKRQICTPGIPWLQRPVPEPWLNKYSFSIFLTTCFSEFDIGFAYAGWGTREKAGEERFASCLLRCFCQASDAPSSRQAARASSSGASLQITLSQARLAPSSLQRDSQLRIHSPSPQP